ncbi:hypothetical protein EPUS_07542 [Endocarpon pusillum Z07020]|uniref:Cep57 centrosome microtubule-binding domain-containing protein n=1 Tax=Endocarpon pusillum (strain Z07020 / HMAS-L-300199) TaxID=1263415 RepID=U1HPQ3_ENDPU|nr:uncharacterized protein EPUS_07542 [Endocarpon pusillum Z07020]ERF72380.1 hypothetical protein EPUS_07542 [Endocarpon pusillum Z07020]
MAPSPQHPDPPRLGTVLSRRNWEERRPNSTISSVVSHGSAGDGTRGSFDPENEALVSTGLLNNSPPKDNHESPKNKAYQIDMKAAKAAFSEGSESGSDAADISIEIGRGGRHGRDAMEDSRNDDSIHSSNAMIGEYRVMYSPPLSTHRRASRTSNNDQARNLRQDAQIRLASMASQKENRDPASVPFKSFKSSDVSSKAKRKTLGEINARASEMYDGSLLNDDRPTQPAPITKTTRFSHSKRDPSNQLRANSTNTATDMADVNQSYALPDLPNLSQLMSGTIQDRTPGRIRLASHPALAQTPRAPFHKAIDTVPIPDDEKAIFVSLNFLQGKVKDLEAATREFQKTIEELKTKNLVLKAEKRDLKVDNDRLRKENVELRTGYAQFLESRQHEQHHQEQISPQKRRHTNVSVQVNNEVSKIVKERQEEDLFSLTPTESVKIRPMSAPPPQRHESAVKSSSILHRSDSQKYAVSGNARHSKKVVIEETTTRSGNNDRQNMARDQTRTQDVTYLSTQPVPQYLLDLRNMVEAERVDAKKRKHGKENHGATSSASHRLHEMTAASTTTDQPTLPRKSSMKDVSRRDFNSESAAAVLARVRAEKESMSQQAYDQDISEDITDQASCPLSQTARRNSDPNSTAASNTSRRRRRTTVFEHENMTSGFIIPDITIAQPTSTAAAAGATTSQAPEVNIHLTDAAQHVIHSVNPHDAVNCIVCSRLTSTTTNHSNANCGAEKKTIVVPKPIPVSDTPVSPTSDNPDPTLRPAQPPGVALAIVLKELHDQHEHLKARLATAQAKYQQTDPRLSRAKRGRLSSEIEKLQGQCDRLADMIYRLYDVVEGQRGSGLEMSEEEVEVTVIGLREVLGRMGKEDDGGSDDGSEGDAVEGTE